MSRILEFNLPLPPSKNARTTRKGVFVRPKSGRGKGKFINIPVLSPAVLAYRAEVAKQIGRHAGKLPGGEKIILECVWYKTRRDQDTANFHDELCDAIAPALGLNDKFFLVRDMDFIVAKPGRVWVQMRATSDVLV